MLFLAPKAIKQIPDNPIKTGDFSIWSEEMD